MENAVSRRAAGNRFITHAAAYFQFFCFPVDTEEENLIAALVAYCKQIAGRRHHDRVDTRMRLFRIRAISGVLINIAGVADRTVTHSADKGRLSRHHIQVQYGTFRTRPWTVLVTGALPVWLVAIR